MSTPTQIGWRLHGKTAKALFILGLLACAALIHLQTPLSAPATGKGEEAPAGFQVQRRESVLVLHAYSPDFAWTRSQQEGIDAVFGPLADTYDVRIEFLDAVHHPELLKGPLLLDLFRAKLADQRFRVVLTSDNAAFDFARAHRAELFPGVPIVFMGVNGYTDSMLQGEKGITGVAEDSDLPGTLQVLLQLLPRTGRIVFPGMVDDLTYRAIRATIDKNLAVLPAGVAAEFPEYPDVNAAIEDLRTLPPDTAMVVMTNMRARDGEGISSQRVVELLSANTPVPLFTNWDFVVGHGAVGGSVISGGEQGRQAAQIAVQILRGERPESIPVRRGAGKTLLFDYRQLERFGIPSSHLPAEAVILFGPERFLRISREVAWTSGVLFALLLGVTASLIVSVRRRRRAEEQVRSINQGLEERVRERTAELEAANKAKSLFLANMSHELRTPLNAVLGFAQLMRNAPDVTVGQRANLEIISRSGEHLLNLINNVLDISKIESGRVEIEEAPVDLVQLTAEVESLMHDRASGKGLEFALEEAPELPRHIVADGGKLRQVLLNLTDNAIKYTTEGRITLRVLNLTPEASDRGWLRFEVADSGPGIRQEDRERIFSPFVQLGESSTFEQGTGLGLAICKQFVELMGGEIGVNTPPEGGSIFWFTLQVSILPAGPEKAPPEQALGKVVGLAPGEPCRRLLIAEDQPENRLLLRKLLEPLGFELREAANGKEALAVFEEWRPDLIWMDIRMPVMDGLEATRLIKCSDGGATTRIVAVTAHAFEEERRAIEGAGCDGFIRKPFDHGEIFQALTSQLGVRFIYENAAATVPATQVEAADLATLPEDLRDALEQALCRIDIAAIEAAIEAIRPRAPALAKALTRETRELQFGRLLRLLRTDRGATGPEEKT